MKLRYPVGQPPIGLDVLWRCQAQRYSIVIDPDADIFGVSNPELQMWWYPVKRRTPKGAWISDRFIRLTAFKRYACNTETEAIESFIARKKRQIKILTAQLKNAEQDLALTKENVFA